MGLSLEPPPGGGTGNLLASHTSFGEEYPPVSLGPRIFSNYYTPRPPTSAIGLSLAAWVRTARVGIGAPSTANSTSPSAGNLRTTACGGAPGCRRMSIAPSEAGGATPGPR